MKNLKMEIKKVKQVAMKNYENGGDMIIECWTDEDIAEWLKENKLEDIYKLMEIRAEQVAGIKNTIW